MDKSLNILFLSLDQSLLGVSTVGDTYDRLTAYKKFLNKIVVIVPTTRKPKRTSTSDNINIIPAYSNNKILAYFKLFLETKRIICEEKIDLVTCNDPVLSFIAILARLISGRKTSIEVNVLGNRLGNIPWIFEKPHHIFLWLIHYFSIKFSDQIRSDNSGDTNFLIQKIGIPKDKITTIPMVPSHKSQAVFLNTKPDPEFKKKLVGNNIMFLSIGTLTKNKDFSNLIKAIPKVVSKYQNVKFVIVGDGPEKKSLVSLAKKLKVTDFIKHLPAVGYQDLPKLYVAADAYVLPSNQEGLPRVMMEAALSNCPIITTDIYGASDMVQNGYSGIIVPKRSPDRLSQAIIFALARPHQMRKFAAIAKNRAIKYLDFDTNVKKLIESWEKITANS